MINVEKIIQKKNLELKSLIKEIAGGTSEQIKWKLKGGIMISILHLLWIVPMSTIFGFAICALLAAAKYNDKSKF